MSAYIVSIAHIAAIVRVGLAGPIGHTTGPGTAWHTLRWYASDPRELVADAADHADYFRRLEAGRRELTRETAQRVAYMLMTANVASVWHRYPDDTADELPGPRPAYWTGPAPVFAIDGARPLTAVQALKALDGYEYQSCELPGWTGSEAQRFIDALRGSLISALPGYDDADTWEVDDRPPEPPPAPPKPAPEPPSAANDRDSAIAAIRSALRRRTGRAWSVTGGRGTAWGWIGINAPPSRRGDYSCMSDDDRATLAAALGLETVHQQGVSIPASTEYRAEYIDRAEGRDPSRYGSPYWD